ncbi:MAG: hypothetical protein QG556_826 [Pseudomonadota bacterium]|nr:hypothetical protein [Pseudomonadota bacterium]
MESNLNAKVNIYKGMIEYVLETTDYNLKRIAHLSNSSIGNIKMIYSYGEIPEDFKEEMDLVRLYMMILDMQRKRNEFRPYKLYAW